MADASSESRPLKGRRAAVTGSTSGIGLAIADALARAGADVAINGFGDHDAALKEVAARGTRVEFVGGDMSRAAEVRGFVADVQKRLGGLDILVNNAGIQHVAPIEDFPEDKWDAIIALNLSAVFHATKAAVPAMKAGGWGRVVNIASVHGLVASPFKSAYVAAKHGVVGLTKTAALELAETRVTVNAICPGFVDTPLVRGQIADQAKANRMTEEEVVRDVILASQPTKRLVTVDQVAALAIYLCSDAADGVTGAALSIDGGWTAR